MEALAAGVPIVQPNIGGYPGFIEATGGGVLYEPNTADQLSQSLASVLDDPERMKSMADQGYQTVHDRYSMKNMAESIIRIYESILK